jgi:hypothetical protein
MIQAELGLPATARSMADAPSSRVPSSLADSYGWSDDLMSKAALELQRGEPLGAARTLERLSARLDSFMRKKRAPGKSRGLINRRIRCTRLQGHVARILMQFGQSLDLFQSAMSLAAQSENHDDEVWLRLTKARVYLHYIGDCRQAEDHLVDDDSAVAQESPELRIQHALLRAGLHDKFGQRDEAARLLGVAEQLLPKAVDDPLGSRIELGLCALTLDLPADRVRWLQMLCEALGRFDAPSTRLTRLRGLRYCAPVHGVPRELAKTLENLTHLPGAAEAGIGRIAAPDRLKLSLRRLELLRVVGDTEAARKELLALRPALKKYGNAFQDREVATTCDALGLDETEVLPGGWIGRFLKEYRNEPTLCGAVTLEEAERAFKRGMIEQAGRLAVASQEQLQHDDAVRSVFDLHCSELQAEVAKQHGDSKAAKRFESSAAAIRDELGIRRKRHSLSVDGTVTQAGIVRDRFIEASDGLVLRVDSADTFGALAWADPPIRLGAETIKGTGFLPSVLRELGSGPLSGSGSLALIRELGTSWPKLGELLAECVCSDSLREMLPRRLDRSGPQGAGADDTVGDGLEIVLECEQPAFHAVPWELITLARRNPTPLSSEPGVRHLWRGSMDRTTTRRLAWATHATRALLGPLGTKEANIMPSLVQRELKLPITGRFDARTRLALRHAVRDQRPYSDRPLVLLVQSTAEREVQSARGFSSGGTNLQEIYEAHGLRVERIEEPDPERLRAALRRAPVTVVHLATPVAESRAGSDLFLQFGSDVDRSATAFTASHLATVLKSASSKTPAPLVIVETPRPPSLDEALRQLVLRNVFAAQLYLFGRFPAVIATGLGNPFEQQRLSVMVADGIVTRRSPGEIVQQLRQALGQPAGPPPSSRWSPEVVLSTSCALLFAEDPDLDPQDLFTVRNA